MNANSTNILPSSEQVGGGGWGLNGTLTSNTTAVAAPDGSYTADAVTAPTGGGLLEDYVSNADVALYDGATVTASVYLCVPSGTTLNGFSWFLENSNGTTPSTVQQTVNLTSTWQRFELPPAVMQNNLANIILGFGNSTTFPAGQTVYVWGAQIVTGSSAGPPIETTDSTTYVVNGSTVYLAANGLNESYSYDGFGNMLEAGNFNFVQAYTTANQLSGWSYDASGNLLIDGQNTGYAYDAEGRVSGVGTYSGSNGSYTFNPGYSYVYGADGNRVAKSGGAATDYIYFGGKQLARLAGGQWTDLIYGPTGLLAEVPGMQTGAPVYRMVDHLGTAVGTLSSTGTVLSLTDYAPFGQVFAGGSTDPYKFTGKERDTESGNDYFGARYYASSMGRWMSPDLPFADQDPVNPQSWNLYGYVRNNPLNSIDDSGLLTIIIGGTGYNPGNWNYSHSPLTAEAQQNFHDPAVGFLYWSGGLSDTARIAGAEQLRKMINSYQFAPGEQLNIIAHSHGGNVALLAAQMNLKHPISNLITLGTPGLQSYAPNANDPGAWKNIGNWYNIQGSTDSVPGLDSDTSPGNRGGAQNFTVPTPGFDHWGGAHTALWQNNGIRNLWWSWWLNQQGSGNRRDDARNLDGSPIHSPINPNPY